MKLEDYISEAISHGRKRTGYYIDVDSETSFTKFTDILKSAGLIQYKKCGTMAEYKKFRQDSKENQTPEFSVDTIWKTITVFLHKQNIEWEIGFEYYDVEDEHRVENVYKHIIVNGKAELDKTAKYYGRNNVNVSASNAVLIENRKKEVNDLLLEMCRALEEE